jgi:uncharacterized protein (DUF2336 family)
MTRYELDGLAGLARDATPARRAELLGRLGDLYFRAPAENAATEGLFDEVMSRLLVDVDTRERERFSHRIAHAPRAPRGVVLRLAQDVVRVAEPVLVHSAVLTERDLATFAASLGEEHLAVMSRRIFLSETVTERLIERGGRETTRALAGNDGAQIDERGLDRLAVASARDPLLAELVALRPTLSAERRAALMPLVPRESRTRIERVVRARADRFLSKAMAEGVSLRVGPDGNTCADLIEAFDEGVVTLDEALSEATRSDQADCVVDLLAFGSPLDRARVHGLMHDRDPRPLAVLCRARQVSSDTYRRLIDLRAKSLRVGSNDPRYLREYEAMDPGVAASALVRLRQAGAAA